MNDEYEPDTPIMSVETPSLTGTPTLLTGSETSMATPDGSSEYNFITGPDGQTYAVMNEPFVWKKFFIGLGIPLFLMIVPIILAGITEGMNPWNDDDFESEKIDLQLVNGTAYATDYNLESDRELEWCWFDEFEQFGNERYECQPTSESSLTIFVITEHAFSLIRGNGTSYYANFSLESDQSIDYCDIRVSGNGWAFCAAHQTPSSHLHLRKETYDDIRNQYDVEEVGQWNETSNLVEYDDGEGHGSQIPMTIYVREEVGHWAEDEGELHFDSGDDHGASVEINVETRDVGWDEESENTQATIDVLLGISWIMCLAAPILSIVMMAYGFAASGAKAMGVGAMVALASYPVIGFFGCIAMMSSGF